jgi:hypothetical protein
MQRPAVRNVREDGHAGLAFVRKPPGKGPFPAAVIIHWGLVAWPEEQLRKYALNSPLPMPLPS